MDVKSVSSNSFNVSITAIDKEIQSLQKYKMQLQNQISKVKESKMDAKMKQDKISALNEQISDVDTQIQQKQLEKMKPDNNVSLKNTEEDKTRNEETGGNADSSMVSAMTGYSELKTMGKVRTDLKNQMRIATDSGENPAAGEAISQKIDKLENDMQNKSEEINEKIKKAAEKPEKSEEQEKDDTVKNQTMQDGVKNIDTQNLSIADEASIQEDNREKANFKDNYIKTGNSVKKVVQDHGTTVDVRI